MRIAASAAGCLALCLAAPVAAQDQGQSVFEDNHLTVGVGIAYGPSYDGSDDYKASPVPVIRGSFGGIGVSARSGGIAIDFIDGSGKDIDLDLGAVARLRKNRAS